MIPLRYENSQYKDVPVNIRKSFENIKESRQGIYIHGGVGTGKTHIAYALHKESVETAKVLSQFWNTTELFREIRLDISRTPEEKKHIEEELMANRTLLILDDIGAEKISDWVLEVFYLIINRRYENMLPTIFTSNLPISELAERIGDRTVSRIVEMCKVVRVDGKDRRLNK